MTRRRFTLPRLRTTRKSGRHFEPRTHRTTHTARRSRSGIIAATALLALTAGTATAVGPLGGDTDQTGTAPVVESAPTDEPTTAGDPTPGSADTPDTPDAATVAATVALQRAKEVAAESTSVSKKERKRLIAQADEVAGLLLARDDQAASRSGERTALPTLPVPGPAEEVAQDEVSSTETGTTGPEEADDALAEATEELTALVQDVESTVEIEAAPVPPTPAETLAAKQDEAADAAKKLAKQARSVAGYENGRIPSDAMCELSFAVGETLRCDAAAQLERLDTAYQAKFGQHLSINDSYRSYPEQVATKASKGYLAAVPGHSNHGLGVAVDLGDGVESFGSPQYEWLRKNAPAFGWDNPDWARADGRKPEAWHWEYEPLD
ncbi:D-alanyl-D-alanine carboxypeptidase family protein [Isoptericola croceus]|uniref:D-alanyl-D-alanine carboxypeptidase family protein n=1 Tax=Isoptericola croceus TaxID=3031406 RepID=UPI0023F7AA04|nr:D-alanyl-D-alanine carboxypeptidase family protein [Isoptericola croceus]